MHHTDNYTRIYSFMHTRICYTVLQSFNTEGKEEKQRKFIKNII